MKASANLYGSLDPAPLLTLNAIRQTAQKHNKLIGRGKGRANSLLMNQLKLTSRSLSQELSGNHSSNLIDYAFVVGPNISTLENSFSMNSTSRDFRFVFQTSMRCTIEPELIYIEKGAADSDLEVDALPHFCFPLGIEVSQP
jgi:hypothetical protein